jgi:phage tail sheath protein FI
MASSFQLSPGVRITETDLSAIIPAVSTSPAAHAAYAEWGPVLYPTQFSNENDFVIQFGKPNLRTFTGFFTVANFLSYSSNILFTRAASTSQFNSANPIDDVAGPALSTISSVQGSYAITGATSPAFSSANVGKYLITSTGVVIGQIASVAGVTALTLVAPATVTVTDNLLWSYGFRVIVNNRTDYDADIIDLDHCGEFIGKYPGDSANGISVYMADKKTFAMPVAVALTTSKNVFITSLARTSDVVSVVTAIAHNLIIGQKLKITGAPGFNFDGVVKAAGSPTTFTYDQAGADVVAAYVDGALANSIQACAASGVSVATEEQIGSWIVDANNVVLGQVASVDSTRLMTLENYPTAHVTSASYTVNWKYYKEFDGAPLTSAFAANVAGLYDEIHVIVVDDAGKFSGVAGTILEKYPFLSKAINARSNTGATQYYVDVINTSSKYVWFANAPTTVSGTTSWGAVANSASFKVLDYPIAVTLSKGANGNISTEGQIMSAFALYANTELYDISLLLAGKASYDLANYLIQDIAEVRKDCVAFISPENILTAEYVIGGTSQQTADLKAYADLITASSYGFIDSGAKYQYDLYNDTYRWLPLNGDVGGITARTDETNDPWWSPAGYNRGQVKNVTKLGFNPHSKTDRDVLYQARINPVMSERGQGVLLFGDKTALAKPSAFDRINVRRLFIVLEKSIAIAAKYMLFEFNDSITRNLFIGMVLPFLRDVQGRRGIQSFKVVCDETNNTNEVIASNNFVADIYIQPNYSINFITLNFIATRTGAATFTEV